jgi:hypothetical protein
MSANTPIDVDDPARDEAAIRERLMSELGKRQIDAEKNGRSMEFNVTDVWQASFPAYQSKEHVDKFIERYRTYSGFFELLPNDMIKLTESGRRYCRDLESI